MADRIQYWCRSCPALFANAASSNAHHDATGHHQSGRCHTCYDWLSHHSDEAYAKCNPFGAPTQCAVAGPEKGERP